MTKPANYPKEPCALWERFYQITRIPRPSKKETKMVKYLVDSAKKANLEYQTDSVNNVVIYLPGSTGFENHDPVIIQSHMDMVCDKTPDRKFDFENDPIDIMVENGWITADRTTLGADNGFGCAMALALIDSKGIKHPPLELLFTIDEETGLNGALNLDASMLKGRKLINIDSEEWGTVYVGCAGGATYKLTGDFQMTDSNNNYTTCRIDVAGLKGGHSGLEIHSGLGNAMKILAQTLSKISETGFELVSFEGGRAHNIITGTGHTIINLPTEKINRVKEICNQLQKELKQYLTENDSNVEINISELKDHHQKVLSSEAKEKFLSMLHLYPHGACNYNWQTEDPLVTHSVNMALIKLHDGKFYLESSIRFVDRNQARPLSLKIKSFGTTFGLDVVKHGEYPSWRPSFDNQLLNILKEEYCKNFDGQAKVKVIHAGLECGILKDRIGEMDAISIGPNMKAVHSTSEALEIKSSSEIWVLLLKILERL